MAPNNDGSDTDTPLLESSLQLPSYYSTAGIIPHNAIVTTPYVVSIHNIDESHCTIHGNVSNKIVILNGSLPSFMACNKDFMGKSITLARILFKKGAVGVLVTATEQVCLFVIFLSLLCFICFYIISLLLSDCHRLSDYIDLSFYYLFVYLFVFSI